MDDRRFDDLTRILASRSPRRRLLRAAGGALGSLLAGGGLAAGRRRAAAGTPADPGTEIGEEWAGEGFSYCPVAKVCGQDCCGENETCVGLAAPPTVEVPGQDDQRVRTDSDPDDLLACICIHGFVRNRSGECVCPPGRGCGSGCCEAGETCCDGLCVNTDFWNSHCGACGVTCPAGMNCAGGTCHCPTGHLTCGDTCVPSYVQGFEGAWTGCCSDADCPGPGICDEASHRCLDCLTNQHCPTGQQCCEGNCWAVPSGCTCSGGSMVCGV